MNLVAHVRVCACSKPVGWARFQPSPHRHGLGPTATATDQQQIQSCTSSPQLRPLPPKSRSVSTYKRQLLLLLLLLLHSRQRDIPDTSALRPRQQHISPTEVVLLQSHPRPRPRPRPRHLDMSVIAQKAAKVGRVLLCDTTSAVQLIRQRESSLSM
jgi:hypothetical protein